MTRARRLTRVSIKKRAAVFAIVVSLVVAGSVGHAQALGSANTARARSQQQEINKQLSQLRGELSEVSGEHAELLGRLDEINNRKTALDAQIAELQGLIDEVQRQLDEANGRLNAVQQQVDQAQVALQSAREALALTTKQLRDQAVNAYVGKDPAGDMDNFMFRVQNMRELSAASEYIEQVVADRRAIVEQHKELQGQAEDLKNRLDAMRSEAQAARDVIVQQSAQLVGQRAQLDALHAQVQYEADQQQALLAEVDIKRASIQQQMDQLQAQSDSIGAMLRQSGGGGSGPPPGRGIISSPIPGAYMSSAFGMRHDPVLNRYQLHAGQDYAVSMGTPIRAAADGTVVSVLPSSSSGGYGNYTCISHGSGLATCYAHQSQFLVSVGQRVVRGQVIGLVGSTGFSTGPHLHFEVRINGNPVDPRGYL